MKEKKLYSCSLYKYFLLESVRKVRYWRGKLEKKVKT